MPSSRSGCSPSKCVLHKAISHLHPCLLGGGEDLFFWKIFIAMVFTKLWKQCFPCKVMSALQCETTGKNLAQCLKNKKRKSSTSLFIVMWGWKSIYLCDTPACGLEKGPEILQYGEDLRIRMEPGNSQLKAVFLSYKVLQEEYRQDFFICQISGWYSYFGMGIWSDLSFVLNILFSFLNRLKLSLSHSYLEYCLCHGGIIHAHAFKDCLYLTRPLDRIHLLLVLH